MEMKQQRSSKTDVRKQTRRPDKRKSPTVPPSASVHPSSVVPKDVVSHGDAPSGSSLLVCILQGVVVRVPSRSLGLSPLEFTHYSPSAPLDRSLPPPHFSPLLIPGLPAGAFVVLFPVRWGWLSVPHMYRGQVRWFVVDTKSGSYFGRVSLRIIICALVLFIVHTAWSPYAISISTETSAVKMITRRSTPIDSSIPHSGIVNFQFSSLLISQLDLRHTLFLYHSSTEDLTTPTPFPRSLKPPPTKPKTHIPVETAAVNLQ